MHDRVFHEAMQKEVGSSRDGIKVAETKLTNLQKVVATQQDNTNATKKLATDGVNESKNLSAAIEIELNGLKVNVETLQRSVEQIRSSGGGGAATGVTIPGNISQLFEALERQLSMYDAKIAEMDVRFEVVESTSYNGKIIWKITDFARRREDARRGKTLSIYSQPFYSSKYGYKMCLRIYPNGDGMGKNTHISLFFVLMKGDYDSLLQFPFRQKGSARHVIQPGNARKSSGNAPIVVDIDEMPTILEANKGLKNLKEGDIELATDNTRNTISDTYVDSFWPNKSIAIVYASGTTMLTKAAVDEARREYELRTCLSLPLRTNEENYITVRVLNGCFSSVGMIGGNQVLSIGIGCEQMSTVIHEFMHAFGVWHEQSRADRDDYIEINYNAIDPDLAYNFDNYDFATTDDRRVSYDFDSVMHYDKTAFSIDGNNTIITRDPAFQDVIGQRSGFSVGDVTKLSRMYDCSQPLRVTNHEEFETESVGGYTPVGLNGNVEWLRHVVGESPTDGPTTKYLPTYDATHGVQGEGSFLYLDTSLGFPGQSAWTKSMRYTSNVARQCLEFSYYLRLNVGSLIKFYVYLAEIDEVTGDIISYGEPLWSHTTSTLGGPEFWRVQRMTISAPRAYRLAFYGITGQYYNDVIAIDDISVVDRECDTGYFLVPEYNNLMATYLPDEYYQSPVMYTGNPGYAFQVLVYPNGWQSSIDSGFPGYMSMYFRLIGGHYDDQLSWPFDQQFIRFVITDQGPNPTERMNYFYNFLTDASSLTLGDSWQKPVGLGSTNVGVGYRTFFYNERFYTRKYLKSNVAYFSVQVTDMRNYNESDGPSVQRNPLLIKPEERLVGERINWPTEVKAKSFAIDNDYEEHDHQNQDGHDHHSDDYHHEDNHHEHDHHEHHDENEGVPPGMISIKSGLLIVFVTSGVVFFVMAALTCYVARSYKGKQKTAPAVMTDVRFGPGLSKGSNAKYYDRREIL